MATEYTYSDDCYSDLHKDALGVRPSQGGYELWATMTPDEKQAWWDYLIRVMVRSEEEARAHEHQCIEAFELQVTRTMDAGAETRDQAIRWLLEASEWGGDREYFCCFHGLPYNYFHEMQLDPNKS